MKKYLVSALALALGFCLFGCSDQGSSEHRDGVISPEYNDDGTVSLGETNDSKANGEVEAEAASEQVAGNEEDAPLSVVEAYTLEQAEKTSNISYNAGGHHYFIVESDDKLKPLDTLLCRWWGSYLRPYRSENDSSSVAEFVASFDEMNSSIPVVGRSESIAIFESNSLTKLGVFPIEDDLFVSNAIESRAQWSECVNGVDLDGTESGYVNALKEFGITRSGSNYYSSSEEIFFTYGRYEGTKWVEYRVDINNPCLDRELARGSSAPIELNVEKTKNGYFLVRVSELEPGRYVVEGKRGSFVFAVE